MLIQKKQEIVKKQIMNSCKTCHGNGCRDCAVAVEKINLWASSGIPTAYWEYGINNFNGDPNFKNKIQEMSSQIDKIYLDGKSFAFLGKFGVGKTFGATFILKSAIVKRYSCLYTTMTEVIDSISMKDFGEFKQRVLASDFLILDEVDSRYLPSSEKGRDFISNSLENIIRTRFQHKLPTIFCSNNASLNDLFDGIFEQAFNSLFSENLIVVPVGGRDLRAR